MIERVMETETVHIHEIVIHVDHLEAAELIACRKNEFTAMLVCEFASGIIGGSGVPDLIVSPAVLHYNRIQFLRRIPYSKTAVVYGKVELLVRIMCVNIGIAANSAG
jgi:hypothetical protein